MTTACLAFEDRPNPAGRIQAISRLLVNRFVAQTGREPPVTAADIDIYRRMRLIACRNAHDVPRNVALLFFNENPDYYFGAPHIKLAEFRDHAGADLIRERTFAGPLHEQVWEAVRNVMQLTDLLIFKRPDRPEADHVRAYPREAVEEALVNAVYHRSYEFPPEPVKVYAYPNRLAITSYPGPVPGIERDHFRTGSMVPTVPARNRRVGEFLKELKLAESRGTGLRKIERAMRANGSAPPRYDFDQDRTYFSVTLPVQPRYQVNAALRGGPALWVAGERQDAIAHVQSAFDDQPQSGALAGMLIAYASTTGDADRARAAYDRFEAQPAAERTETTPARLAFATAMIEFGDAEGARNALGRIPRNGTTADDEAVIGVLEGKLARMHIYVDPDEEE